MNNSKFSDLYITQGKKDMNKKIIYTLTAIALQNVIFQSASAADGQNSSTVKITSNIIASPCTVETASSNIDLGTVTASFLNNSTYSGTGDYSVPILIKLMNCPETTTSVSATFSGTPSTQNGKYFKNTSASAGDAAAMDIEFDQYIVSSDAYNYLQNGSMIKNVAVKNGEASFALAARMINTTKSTTIGAGNVSTAISVDFSYK